MILTNKQWILVLQLERWRTNEKQCPHSFTLSTLNESKRLEPIAAIRFSPALCDLLKKEKGQDVSKAVNFSVPIIPTNLFFNS